MEDVDAGLVPRDVRARDPAARRAVGPGAPGGEAHRQVPAAKEAGLREREVAGIRRVDGLRPLHASEVTPPRTMASGRGIPGTRPSGRPPLRSPAPAP